MKSKVVKILNPPRDCPKSIPAKLMAPYEHRAMTNHSQTFDQLNEGGGLDILEAYFILKNEQFQYGFTLSAAIEYVKDRITKFEAAKA